MKLGVELYTTDLAKAEEFYGGVLGFEIIEDNRSGKVPYLGFARGQARIGVARSWKPLDNVDHTPPLAPELVLCVEDLEAEVERFRTAHWPLFEEIKVRPWGATDFRVKDPDGHLLRITTSD